MSGVVLLKQENKELRTQLDHLQQKKRRSRTYLQHGSTLIVKNAQQLILDQDLAEQANITTESSQPRQRAPPTCSNCHQIRHNRTQCKIPLNSR
jgi:hypothetical protein